MASKIRSVLAGTVQGSNVLFKETHTHKENAASLYRAFHADHKKTERI
jgi:hypothetical protein